AQAEDVAAWAGGHCVQFLVAGPTQPVDELRTALAGLGADSVLVVGDSSLLKVHVHVARPDAALAVGRAAGRVEDVVVEDFDEMVAEHERATGIVLRSPPRGLAALAVVSGPGLAKIARSLGASVVAGGATMNPSVGQLAEAIERANAARVVVLPNDRNVILAAQQAAALAGSAVEVLPTRSIAQGMAALVAFDERKPADEVVAHMTEAATAARGIEVTRATRATTLDGQEVREGDAIALLDGALVARGDDEIEVLGEAARRLEGAELLTLYVGAGVDAARAEGAAQRLREACAGAEVEVVDGGQPHYPFLVAAE
ncbi:MAG: DAK2 domain-containing protein, partial [Candidatus Limnocylindria bacterium]